MAGLRCRGEFGGGEPLPDSFKPTIRVPLRGRVPSARLCPTYLRHF